MFVIDYEEGVFNGNPMSLIFLIFIYIIFFLIVRRIMDISGDDTVVAGHSDSFGMSLPPASGPQWETPQPSDTSSSAIEYSTKAISVRVVIALLCLVSIISSVSVISSFSTVVCDEAISDTRETADNATGECFNQASSSLETNSRDLMVLSSNSIGRLTNIFFESFYTHIRQLIVQVESANNDTERYNWEWWKTLQKPMAKSLRLSSESGLALLGIQSDQFTQYYLDVVGLASGDTVGAAFYDDTQQSKLGFASSNTGKIIVPLPGLDFHPLRVGPLAAISEFDIIPKEKLVWTDIYELSIFIGVILSYHIRDVNNRPVYMYVAATIPKISLYLKEISEGTKNETGADIRIYFTIASSWISTALRDVGTDDANREADKRNQTGLLTGVSHGQAVVEKSPGKIVLDGTFKVLKDVEATDPVIRGIAKRIQIHGHDRYSLTDRGIIEIEDNNTTVMEDFFISTKRVKRDGIDWWLTLGLPSEFALGEVGRANAATKTLLAKRSASVESDWTKSRRNMILLAVGISLSMVLFLIIANHLIWRSTTKLNTSMQKVADMQLDDIAFGDVEALSRFHEVRQMQVAFAKMVKNLKEYKAYVPSAVLHGTAHVVAEPPTGNISVVFTDIVSSTHLWSLSHCGMNTALEIHNDIMRKVLIEFKGYEVKTIGDAFMVAFQDPLTALGFCFRVQNMLLKQEWPTEIGLPPQYSDNDQKKLLWNGIRVRMGCHNGEVITEENPLTSRIDYRGTTVNIASRLESKALPGTVCISDSLRNYLKEIDMNTIGNPTIVNHGEHELKGLGDGHTLHIACPRNLSDRLGKRGNGSGFLSPAAAYEVSTTASPSVISVGGDRDTPVAVPVMTTNKRTGLSLVGGEVTVAVCKLIECDGKKVFENCNLLVRVSIESASQTDGVVSTVSGDRIVVAWNGSKPCKMHTAASLRFASQLQRRADSISRIGIATGDMLHGNVGTHKQRFNTIFGRPLRIAEASVEEAFSLNTFSIFADCTQQNRASHSDAIAPFLRITDIWLDTFNQREIVLFQVLTSQLLEQIEIAWSSELYVFVVSLQSMCVSYINFLS